MLLTLSSHEVLLIKMLDQEENTCPTGPTVNLLPSRTQGSSVLPSVAVFHPSPPEDSFLWLNSGDETTLRPWWKILHDPDSPDKTRGKSLFLFIWGPL